MIPVSPPGISIGLVGLGSNLETRINYQERIGLGSPEVSITPILKAKLLCLLASRFSVDK